MTKTKTVAGNKRSIPRSSHKSGQQPGAKPSQKSNQNLSKKPTKLAKFANPLIGLAMVYIAAIAHFSGLDDTAYLLAIFSILLVTPFVLKRVFLEDEKSQKNPAHKCEPFNLLDVNGVKGIVIHPAFRSFFHIVLLVVFIAIIFSGINDVQDLRYHSGDNFPTLMVWGVWHPILAVSILFVGRFWCFMCPVGGTAQWLSKNFGLGKKYPDKLKHLWIAIAFFLLITATEKHLFQFTVNPVTTAYLLLFFTVLAFGLALIFKGRAFCRYICPTGIILAITSMASGSELRYKSHSMCKSHNVKECIVGTDRGQACPMFEFPQTLERNSFCIYCTECMRTCSKDNIRISPRPFFKDIIKSTRAHLDEAFFIHSMIILLIFKLGMQHTPFRNIIINFVRWTDISRFFSQAFIKFLESLNRSYIGADVSRYIWAPIIFIALSALGVVLLYVVSRILLGKSWLNIDRPYIRFTYALIPIALVVYLVEESTFKLLRGVWYLISEASHPFGIKLFEFSPVFSYDSVITAQMILLFAGYAASVYAGYGIAKAVSPDKRTFTLSMAAMVFVMMFYTFAAFRILILPI